MFFWLCGVSKKKKKEFEHLSDLEIKSLKESWNRAKKRGGVGQNILKNLIVAKPLIKDHFGIKVTDGDFAGLLKCEQFQAQAARMENFLDLSIESLDGGELRAAGNMAHRIGSVHFYRGVNFGADNWLAFKKVIIEQILRSANRLPLGAVGHQESFLFIQMNGLFPAPCVAAVAWEKLMGYLIREMKKGFLAEACRNCREDSRDNFV